MRSLFVTTFFNSHLNLHEMGQLRDFWKDFF